MSVNVVGISKAIVHPLNGQTAYSPYQNNNILNFEVAPQASRMLDPRSLRLNFELQVRKKVGDAFPTGDLSAGEDVNISSRIGASSLFDLIRIRQQNTNEVLEETRLYSTMLASSFPANASLHNYKKHVSLNYGAMGKDATQALALSASVPMSLKLRTGLFSVQTLWNLQAMGGCRIELVLNSLSMVLHGGNAGDFYWKIVDPTITFNYVDVNGNVGNSYQLQYPTYTSFSSVVNSSNDQLSMVFAQQAVRSVFATTIKSASLNNLTTNSFTTNRLQNAGGADKKVQELIFYKDSVKFPLDFIVNERDAIADGVYECLKNKLFIECFRSFFNITNTLQSPNSQGTKSHAGAVNGYDVCDNRAYTGLGINYDQLRNAESVSFLQSMFAFRVNSQLDDNTANQVQLFTLSNRQLKTNPMNAQVVS